MTRLNTIQSAILSLDGGAYHNLVDEYLYKKYNFENIHSPGVETGTNKSTKGIPDSFVEHEDGTYTLIMYGTVKDSPFSKLKKDIKSCLGQYKEDIKTGKMKKIIAGYTSTNINPHQLEELKNLNKNIEMKFIGLNTLSQDLLMRYPYIASDHLNIKIDSEQIFTPEEFIARYDNNEMNTPLSIAFKSREKETKKLYEAINQSFFTLVTGQSGVGKTKLAIEACKQYKLDGCNVYCIKNNGLMIHDDIRRYFGNPGKYILFIDDINQTSNLEYILDFVNNTPKDVSIKVVATIRNYAKKHTVHILQKYFKFSEIVVKPFKNDETKTILKDTLKMNDEFYLNKIAKISKGNIRLAILAGMRDKEKGHPSINNASDIFKHYYGEILESQRLSEKDVYILFVISLIQSFRMKENDFANTLLKEFDINNNEFLAICHKLNENELVDLFYDEVVKINNQSFSDYLLEYVLVTKKMISISRLLTIGFPKYKKKIVFALNTIVEIFPSKETQEYIKEQVNISWENSDDDSQMEYLSSFYSLNETKSLQIIKKSMDEMEQQEIDIAGFDEPINNPNIKNEFIKILGGFKYSKYYEMVIDLLVNFFKKRLDLFTEFYAVFSTSYSYDKHSSGLDYKKEYLMINKLWEASEYGEDRNLNFLIIHLFKELLKCSVDKVEPGDTKRTVHLLKFELVYSEGIKKLRYLIWQILSQLYEKDLYKEMIHSVLSKYYGGVINETQYILIFEYDLKCIKELFVDKWAKPTFEQSIVLNTLKERAVEWDVEYDEVYDLYQTNEEFTIYNVLSDDYLPTEDYNRIEEIKKADLINLIDEYEINDFDGLFQLCNKLEGRFSRNTWVISQSISTVFSLIGDWEIFIDVVHVYLKNNAPYYRQSFANIIYNLINLIGVESTKQLLDLYEYPSKNHWLSKFWEIIPEEKINQTHVEGLVDFVSSQIDEDSPFIPNILNLKKYHELDNGVIEKISECIFKMNSNSNIVIQFLNHNPVENDVNTIMALFSDSIEVLEKLYLLNNHEEFDFLGNLLMKLIKNNITFWDMYTREIRENVRENMYFSQKIDLVWSTDNYKELIEIAYSNLIVDKYVNIDNRWSKTIFSMKSKNRCRKESWIKEYIEKHKNEIERLKNIFYLIHNVFENNKLNFFMEFVKHNKNIEDFKQLPIEPASYTWSGSAVPVIDKKINFIQDFKNNLNGIDYLDHIAYLDEELLQLKKMRKETEISEYMSELY